MKPIARRVAIVAGLMMTGLLCGTSPAATPDIFRSWFTPTVVPTNFTDNVRFEAEITGNPSSVVFNYNAVPRLMHDNGSNGDLVAGDSIWTCLFTANEIISKNTSNRVFRPVIGTCVPTNGGAFNTIAEVWTSQIGLVPVVTNLAATNQVTDYVVNYIATKAQLTNFVLTNWSKRFYSTHGDNYDFLHFIHIAGVRGNRYHGGVKNSVQGIGLSLFTNTTFGSAGRLQGYSVFPIPTFYDGAGPGFIHETGHQWINFLSGTPYSNGVPHWPKGNVAINVMGFSIPGTGAGGNYSFTFTDNGNGTYTAGPPVATNITTFNLMELYLMGLAAPAEVPAYFVLNNQNLNVTNGQVLMPAEITLVTINDVIAAKGARVPNSTNSQKAFRCATIILSEQFLDPYAMSLYDYFTRRAEARQPLAYAEGLATGTSNPFYVATGGRAVMFSRLTDDLPLLTPTMLPNNDVQVAFTGTMGITYQPQHSGNLTGWSNLGATITIPVTNPPADLATNFVRTPAPGTNQGYYRVRLNY
jgi:hypothetical protein